MTTNLKLETEAYRSLADLLELAEKTRSLFDQAGAPLPDALQRLIRSNGHLHSGAKPPLPALRPPAPAEAEQDWVWVEMKAATPGTLALAVLRAFNGLLTAREIHERVRALGVDVSMGTIANTGTRAFENKVIGRTEDGHWQLLQQEKAPVLHNSYLWGRPDAFQMTELASHRRNAIVHLLRQNPTGLQVTQTVVELKRQELVRPEIPVNKTLIKADLEAMDGQRVRRRGGNSKKWEAI